MLDLAPELRTPWLGLFGDVDQGIPVADVERLRGEAEPIPTKPLIAAEDTPTVTQFWSGVVGWNVSCASAPSPAVNTGSSELIVYVDGAVQPAGTLLATTVSVRELATVPWRLTAAKAPVVV